MSALRNAAHRVQNSWCKGNLRKEEEARDAGDTYCAVGALAASLLPEDKLLSLDGEYIGPTDEVLTHDALQHALLSIEDTSTEEYWDLDEKVRNFPDNHDWENTYAVLDENHEVIVLSEVIAEKYYNRYGFELNTPEKIFDNLLPTEIIFNFNDNLETTRDEVVAVFLEAAERLEVKA